MVLSISIVFSGVQLDEPDWGKYRCNGKLMNLQKALRRLKCIVNHIFWNKGIEKRKIGEIKREKKKKREVIICIFICITSSLFFSFSRSGLAIERFSLGQKLSWETVGQNNRLFRSSYPRTYSDIAVDCLHLNSNLGLAVRIIMRDKARVWSHKRKNLRVCC
jgi:hypothetical protein